MKRRKGPDEDFLNAVIAHNARWYREGLAMCIEERSGGKPAREAAPEVLRTIASTLRNGDPISSDDRDFVHLILLEIANGEDVRKALRVDPRRTNDTRLKDLIVSEIRRRTPDGKGIEQVFADIARLMHRTPDAIRKIWERTDLFEREEKMVAHIATVEGISPAAVRKLSGMPQKRPSARKGKNRTTLKKSP